MNPWFLAQVRPNADHVARRNLERQGFSTFQPLETRTLVRRSKLVDVLRPFFAGYVFVTYPSTSVPWSLVNSTYGVSRLVKFGNRPAIVPDSVMSDLLGACDPNGVISVQPAVAIGDNVEVIRGPLANFVGHVQRLAPDQRAMILLDILGKQTRVVVPTANLRAASGRTKQLG